MNIKCYANKQEQETKLNKINVKRTAQSVTADE